MSTQEIVNLVSKTLQNKGFCPECGQGMVKNYYIKGGLIHWEAQCIDCGTIYTVLEKILPEFNKIPF